MKHSIMIKIALHFVMKLPTITAYHCSWLYVYGKFFSIL